ncbi:MAG: ribosomal protein [Verrucomicrobiales bacterium]|nr:ribosomal protein [Verrucomicrobiales bacterium]
MAKTEVILTHNIVGLGGESDQVKVSAGYARNFLLPQGFAVPVTQANKRQIEALRKRRAEREAHELNAMTELSKSVSKLICVVKVKTGDDGRMFGTVTPGAISDELKNQFDISLDKKKIHIEKPIKALGEHEIELRLHAEVTSTLRIRVESTTQLSPEAVAAAASAEARTETRGKRASAVRTEKPEGEAKPERKAKA